MKKTVKLILSVILAGVIALVALGGCVDPNIKFVTSIEQTSATDTATTYTITYSNGETSTFTVTNGQNGQDGRSIVSIDKTSSANGVDTYTISYSDSTTSTFTVTNGKDGQDGRAITSVEKTSSVGLVDTYTIYYSDTTTSTFTVTNGKNGQDGQDGEDLKITDIYDAYNATLTADGHSPVTFEEFLEKFLSTSKDNSLATAKCLLSSLALYTEFIEDDSSTPFDDSDAVRNLYTGSGVIYRMDSEYAYIVTNFHVIYSGNTHATSTGGNCYAQRIIGYLYGSEGVPYQTEYTDDFGYVIGYSGSYLNFTIVGGSVTDDIAVIKVPTADLLAVNENATAVTLADDYFVGETAIAIGDANSDGLAVSEGIVSVDSEEISLSVDDMTIRQHRVMRIDTVIYPGNSGCGLFNKDGKLIGICNSGASEENINYAIPVDLVKPVADNIIYHHLDGDSSTNGYIITRLGLSVVATSSKYKYDIASGYGSIIETVVVYTVSENSIISALGLEVNDIITHFYIGETPYKIDRTFDIYTIVASARLGDEIKVTYIRGGITKNTNAVSVTGENLALVTP